MAILTFNPTWVASIDYSTNTYSYDYPLTFDNDRYSKDVYIGIDFEELAVLMKLDPSAVARLYIQTSEGGRQIRFRTHKSDVPPSPDYEIFLPPGGADNPYDIINGYLVYDLDSSFAIYDGGYTGYVGIIELAETGRKGAYFEAVGGPFTTNDIYIEIEGEFQNDRPTLLSPSGGEIKNYEETIRFSWNHNSLLEQKSFELRYRVKGTSEWTIIQTDANDRYYDLSPSTLITNEYEWQVRTTSEYDFVSPWSIVQVFNAADVTPSPIFITPIEGETIGISDLHIEWDSIDQDRYEFELLDSDNNIIWSDAKLSTSQEISIDNILENNQSYTLRLRVNQPGNLFSSWTEINISVDYTAPALPILTLTPDKETGSIEVDIHNPPPTGTEPTPTHQELFRRKAGGQWIKLANLLPNSKYVDYTPASGKTYDYRVIVHGDNDTSSTSNIFSSSVKVKYSQLNLTSDLSQMIRLMFNPSISFSENYSVTTKSFAGRKNPVAEFGELINQSGAIDFIVDDNTLNRLYEFLERQEALLFRDSRGKKMFVVISDMNVNYHSARMRGSYLYEISLSLTEVYYNEAII